MNRTDPVEERDERMAVGADGGLRPASGSGMLGRPSPSTVLYMKSDPAAPADRTTAPPPVRVEKPAPSFAPKPKSLDDVSARLAGNRHRHDRDRYWWYGYARWGAIAILAVMGCAAAYLVIVGNGENLGRLIWPLLALSLLAGVRWFFWYTVERD